MFSVLAAPQRLCDGWSRRDFLRVGTVGGLGLTLAHLARAGAAASAGTPSTDASFGRAKRCVLLFLTGGPPQHDTWDLKPQAPAEVRGELQPIATNVPGIEVSELFPLLAGQADNFCVVRSVTHRDTV